MKRRFRISLALGVLSFALASCGGQSTSTGQSKITTGASAATHSWPATAAQVARATGKWDCKPVYAVPKKDEGMQLAFINPDPKAVFYDLWHNGYEAAAHFYGVKLAEASIGSYTDFSNTVNAYEGVEPLHPKVVGGLTDPPNGEALIRRAKADGAKVLFLDAIIPGAPWYGMPNYESGKVEGQHLAAALKPLLAGAWKNKKLVLLLTSDADCTPCIQRVKAAEAQLKGVIPADTPIEQPGTPLQAPQVLTWTTDEITAHPGARFAGIYIDDETTDPTLKAFQDAGKLQDYRVVAIGGDNLGVSNLLNKPRSVADVGSLAQKPFCEAWNWVEAALAVANGKPYSTYSPSSWVDAANVKQYAWEEERQYQ